MSVLVKVVGTIAKVLEGTVICEIVLTNRCGGGGVDIWVMCNGNSVGSNTTMDQGLCVSVTFSGEPIDTNQVIM